VDATSHRATWITASLALGLFAAALARSVPVGAAVVVEGAVGGRGAYGALVGLNLAAFGIVGPASAALARRWGMRRVAGASLALCAGALALAAPGGRVGVMIGLGPALGAAAGLLALPMSLTVAEGVAAARRGLLVGVLTAGAAVGQVAGLPLIAGAVSSWGPTATLTGAALACCLGAAAVARGPSPGQGPPRSPAPREPLPPDRRRAVLVLGAVFVACGATTMGVVGTHLVPAAHDHGIGGVTATSALAAMAALTLIGSVASGWTTDRVDARQLLFVLYVFRGLSLFFLPLALEQRTLGLAAFVVVFGLDWAASVPPVVALTREAVGPERTGVVVGWLFVAHHAGAAAAAWGAGAAQEALGSYVLVFLAAGLVSVLAGIGAWSVPGRAPAARAARPARHEAAAARPEFAAPGGSGRPDAARRRDRDAPASSRTRTRSDR
jgi:predicted MFS family arabinose efflux permease